MRASELLLTTIEGCNKKGLEPGRTQLQKLAYFINERAGLGLEFVPHYYGPYSREVAAGLESLVALGFVEETVGPLAHVTGGLVEEGRRYEYKLTRDGKAALKSLSDEETGAASGALDELLQEGSTVKNVRRLAAAAKVRDVVKKAHTKPLSADQITTLARKWGWGLTTKDIQEVEGFLSRLHLLKRVPMKTGK